MKSTMRMIILSPLLLAACAEERPPVDGTTAPINQPISTSKTPDTNSNGTIPEEMSEAPEKYFSRFLYKTKGSCLKGDFYHRRLSSGHNKIAQNSKGQDILAHLDIYLKEDGSFEAQYDEMDILEYTPTGFAYKKKRTRILEGKWSVQGSRLVLPGVGSGERVIYNKIPSVMFKYERNIVTQGLKDHFTVMENMESLHSIKPFNLHCPGPEDHLKEFEQYLSRTDRTETRLMGLTSRGPVVVGDPTNKLEVDVFLFENGQYRISVNFIDAAQPSTSFRYVFDGSWKYKQGELQLGYDMILTRTADKKVVYARFMDNLSILGEGGRRWNVRTEGIQIRLEFQPSLFRVDDL